jgi:predicted nucleic acid-binding protein
MRSLPLGLTARLQISVADFLIGAHAALDGGRLLTFDQRTYAKAFPEVTLVGKDVGPRRN